MPPNDETPSHLGRLGAFLRGGWRGGAREVVAHSPADQPRAHVVLLDGTLSSLEPGFETSIGLIYRLLEAQDRHGLHYEPGIAWRGWRNAPEVAAGVGINRQIRRAYAWLVEVYRPGDTIWLLGYSRGAYAVRALSGMIDRVGLLTPEHATIGHVLRAYEHYRNDPTRAEARSFAAKYCHPKVRIRAVGVFDTVQAVGVRAPLIWRAFPEVHAFRSHRLGASVDYGFHAMALDETRRVYALDRWRTNGERTESVEQVWFRGTHGDLGGQLMGFGRARPRANVPLVWMLERLESVGLALPHDWSDRFETDGTAPSAGSWRGVGGLFLTRARRKVGLDPSESLHPTALGHRAAGKLRTWVRPETENAAARSR
ncbi:DUF2235 domain-containing protein [Jannaschia sp. KMU-145]|uniref:DUF2235 domain-containing protein n=1 Tax=Jannaschia halovivens TaxID=3388667 RepID=UPI00396AFA22